MVQGVYQNERQMLGRRQSFFRCAPKRELLYGKGNRVQNYSVRLGVAIEAFAASLVVAGGLAVALQWLPSFYVPAIFGGLLLFLTWWLVWQKGDAVTQRAGLSLGGWMLSCPLPLKALVRAVMQAFAWALLMVALVFPLFVPFWRAWWQPKGPFVLTIPLPEVVNLVMAHLVVIALPEEAFYRGYLQSRLDEVWEPRWRIAGASIGPGLVVSSLVFAMTHLVYVWNPLQQLAVFFPSLLFGWLRARTGGVGASIALHAMANLFSVEILSRGYNV